MDRDYFQHAIHDVVTSRISSATRAVMFFATSGMVVVYAFGGVTAAFGGFTWQSWVTTGNGTIENEMIWLEPATQNEYILLQVINEAISLGGILTIFLPRIQTRDLYN